jgi:hypothetical protein
MNAVSLPTLAAIHKATLDAYTARTGLDGFDNKDLARRADTIEALACEVPATTCADRDALARIVSQRQFGRPIEAADFANTDEHEAKLFAALVKADISLAVSPAAKR